MSAFLGPIHYWLYNKIKLQENFIQNILDVSSEKNWCSGLEKEVEESYGKLDNRPLEDIIDQSNIHGWLQSKISQTESRLAFVVTNIIRKNSKYIVELKEIAYGFGESKGASNDITANDSYKFLNDNLIDGMPCDRVNEVLESDNDKIVWKQNRCVHSDYWINVGGDIDVYYTLRHEIIKGMLAESGLEYMANDDGLNIIRRK